jgi:hypothetical protein
VTSVDVVPEPIDPPTIRAPNQPDEGASMAPGDTEATEGEGGGAGTPPAEGGEAPPAEGGETPPAEGGESEPASFVLPLAIQGYQARGLRIVVFAAADEDEGAAYDGLFIEFAPPETERGQPPARRRPRGRQPRRGRGGGAPAPAPAP